MERDQTSRESVRKTTHVKIMNEGAFRESQASRWRCDGQASEPLSAGRKFGDTSVPHGSLWEAQLSQNREQLVSHGQSLTEDFLEFT